MKVRPTIINWKFEIIIPMRIRLIPLVTMRDAFLVHMSRPPPQNLYDPIP